MSKQAPRDVNFVPAALFEIDGSPGQVYPGQINQVTGRILVDAAASGTNFQTDTSTSTNNQTTFVPSKTVVNDRGFYVNGSRQSPSTNYSIIGGNYVLNSGIPSGCDIILDYTY